MEEKIQKEEGLSLLDIIHLLLSKLAILILVAILGGVFGGAFAIWRTIDVNYYGTEVQFYVNPERPKQTASSEGSQYGVYGAYGRHVMDNMVKLLSSESFTEQLILDGSIVPAPSTEEKPWKITVKGAASEADALQQNINFNKALNENIGEARRAAALTKGDPWIRSDAGNLWFLPRLATICRRPTSCLCRNPPSPSTSRHWRSPWASSCSSVRRGACS